MIDRRINPDFKTIDDVKLLEPAKEVFENGMELFVFNAGEQELVRIEWIFNNINIDERKRALLNVALAGMFLEGTEKHSSAEIAEKADFYGAFLQPEYSFDHIGLTLYVLNKHVEKLLLLVKEILTESIFPIQELETYIRNNKQSLSVSLEKNDFVARRTFNKAIFGNNRYGFSPEPADYDSLNQQDLLTLYANQICAANCTMFVSGKVLPSTLQVIKNIFGQEWDRGSIVENAIEQPYSSSDTLILIEKPGALQSAIRIGNRTINRKHPDFSSLQLVNTILGGYFGSRLMSNIREDKGYTYGIGSGIASLKHGAFFTIATEVGVNVTSNTLNEIEFEINRLKNETVSLEELKLVKNYMVGSFLGSLENVFSHVDKFKNTHFVGLDLDYYRNHIQFIKESTPEDVLATANKYLDYEKMIKVVVGKMEN